MTEKFRDYWEENNQVFVTMGKRYGLTAGCRTVFIGPVNVPENTDKALHDVNQPVVNSLQIHPDTPQQNVTDNLGKNCLICGLPVPGKRVDRLFCSANCRQKASRGKQLRLLDQVQGLTESLAISLEDNRTAELTHRRSKSKHGRPKFIVLQVTGRVKA